MLTAGFFIFRDSILDILAQLNLKALKENYSDLRLFFVENPTQSAFIFFIIYVLTTAISLPGAAVLTIAGGAIFGLIWGTVIVSFASTIGATAAFLLTRYFFRNYIREKFGDRLKIINNGVQKDGAFYLLTLRLVPIFPFFAINVLMALTPIKTSTFYLASQLGMFLGTVIFVNAGTQLANLTSIQDILSPSLILSLCILGLFPIGAKYISDYINRRRVYSSWKKPKRFDYNLIVIGGGSAGLVSSYIGATVKARVALIEKDRMGGDCLNTGCVPSKALIKTAELVEKNRKAVKLGVKSTNTTIDFSEVMRRVKKIIKKIEPHDSVERYTKLGVDCFSGNAKLVSPWHVRIQSQEADTILTARAIIIASGASPIVPPLPGVNNIQYLTSNTIWDLEELPKRLVVIGGGAIGCELSQAFQRLGSKVILIESMERILINEDEDVSETMTNHLSDEGVTILTRHRAKGFLSESNIQTLVCEGPNGELEIVFDRVLFAMGRKANVSNFGLDEIGAVSDQDTVVPTNDFLQTKYPNIYACGDVTGLMQFTHAAAHQAWYASVNALFGMFKKFSVDFSAVPWAIFTQPQIARVGLNEREAKDQGISYDVTRYELDDLDRAIADSDDYGYIKLLTKPGSDQILGVTIVGEHGAETISEFVLAMRHNLGASKILNTTHIYPTFSEANKYVAGEWKKRNAPEMVLKLMKLFHNFRRK